MKRVKERIKHLALLTVCLLSGYSDFLDSYNPSAIADDFYNTKEGQKELLTDIDARYRNVFNAGELQCYGTSIYMAISEEPTERMFNGYDKTFNSTAPIAGDYWEVLYKIAQESSILLDRCTPDIAGNGYTSLTTQARFLRAMAYYYLIETFGPVPLLTEEDTSVIQQVERIGEQAIYTFIITELNDIKDKLDMTTTFTGKVANAAAIHLSGEMYLTRTYKSFAEADDFSNAAATFDLLIENPASGYALQENYAALFDENNQANSGIIWVIQYGLDRDYRGNGNPQQTQFGSGITALGPDLFIKNQNGYSSVPRKYWVNLKVHELYTDPETDTRYDATFKREYYINNPDNTDYDKLGVYFPRWNNKLGMNNNAKRSYPFKQDDECIWYPQSTALPILETVSNRVPMVRKFSGTKIQQGKGGSRKDVIFRLGDTYLLCAEAYLGAGNRRLTSERIGSMRKRAAENATAYEVMKLTDLNINVIMDERARELIGEHDHWFDLKRTQTLLTRVSAYNPFVVKYDNLNKNHLVRPTPQDERNKVDGLSQNKGY